MRAVWVLQRALIQWHGQSNIDADGLYGPATATHLEFVNSDNECRTLS